MREQNIRLKAEAVIEGEETFLAGVKDCIPTLLGYLSIGFAAGVVEKTAGLSITEIALLSICLYAGSAQFIAAGMMAANGSASAIIITIFFVNLRHILLSAALSPYFRHLTPVRNMLIGSLLTDETFGVAINEAAKRKRISEKWMHGLNITAYANWIIANIAGAYLGQWIADPEKFGLDFALPAMFIGLLVLSMVSRKQWRLDIVVGISAVVLAVGVSLVLGGNIGVIAATLIASTIGMVIERWK
ncbi:AzlC family ABC transporter permease [Brevibacillus centrosporus]|jgi:4-azaleucine resistance transporter AzlC|uniref:4-azaleucine resistance probable transporter AzlC n=1 Tax=Brevibacillus centrosporus TaxID=54910 RepID=A0A1I3XPS8_9BACL|nr:AzlC family ABC transporter permease [Brevibacillus centrosporus]MEC2128840.1 AzlC family ABC transporter permease [Brevibacillus centrosporus]MED1953025.1 AzlC family ABC transporter permease [Brevibacillus centrosporus]MED4910480.1 AzlC family ABC transporter permease [Brevibacillus centrosporus]RNB71300.1 branched-chain amino acid ABC transporter permease [Brevibacillus centrosporus]SFK21329.1 4-azaleucine resistance probable transporter AzlC [Brevibacillus centrosporus]